MSNASAIAAVTWTLRSILDSGVNADPALSQTDVTILPLDKARDKKVGNQLNLFLYQVARNPAWVNADMPRQVQPGETGNPPLPLNLYYLLTAFGRGDDTSEPVGHELLGKAMSVLHDHPVLSAAEIKAATATTPPGSDLDRQLERIRVTLHPITLDELSKLWTGFASQFRLSAAYEVGVALIESTRAAKTPLPVLTRGPADTGVASQPDLTPPTPTLEAVTPPNGQPSARLKDVLTLDGFNLDGANVAVRFKHPLWTDPVEQPPEPGATGRRITVAIPDQPADWPAGFYTLEVLVQRAGEGFRRSTNQIAVALAPAIDTVAQAQTPTELTLTVTSRPEVRLAQRAVLLVGDREITAAGRAAPADPLVFVTSSLASGDYALRLRVDGVDSLLVDRTATPPVFDPSQKVTIP